MPDSRDSDSQHPVLLQPCNIQEPLDFSRLYATSKPVELELGSGDGGFILHAATSNPDHNFLAVERLLGRLRKIERGGILGNLSNLRAVRIEISYLMRFLIPPSSIHAIHVYFPDPWPKKRHARHRLFRPQFTRWAARVLEVGGTIYMRTDDVPYFDQLKHTFSGDPEFIPCETPPHLASFRTEFEQQWNSMGIPTNYAAYQWHPIESPQNNFTPQQK